MNNEPLASRLRPKNLSEYVGQDHLVGSEGPLRKAIEEKRLFSMILYGPPGTGKTTLARIYTKEVGANFVELSAVSAGKADVKKIVERNINALQPTVLFLDEIHRFNKAQQDYLLPYVENGDLTLIGATTENPSFEIISPLLSRCRLFVLNELSDDNLRVLVTRSVNLLGKKIKKDSTDWLIRVGNGDARQVLTIMDNAVSLYGNLELDSLKNTMQNHFLRFDKNGEEHYNTISALIKSMRASNTDASLYYLARLVNSGEDPKFIARRLIIFASEDIGMAVPTALVVANEVFRAVEVIGYPECQINLAHGVTYLSQCKKNRTAYDAYFEALADVKKFGNLPIPMNLRNAPTKLMKNLGYGKDYQMYTDVDLLPKELKGKKYYRKKS